MQKMIAYCGLDCTECDAYIATKNEDEELKRTTAKRWSKEYGSDIRPEDVNCVGCMEVKGAHIIHWDRCDILKCCKERDIENCGQCSEFPCEKINSYFEEGLPTKERLENIKNNL